MATKRSLKGKHALVTCGPTWVAIDDVRVISNRSSGQMGHIIAELLIKEGVKVTLLEGPVTHVLKSKPARIVKFKFFEELSLRLEGELKKNYDIVIHAAAVSDYAPQDSYGSKLSSDLSNLKIELVPTVKLINKIKKASPKSFLVGFKLESDTKEELLRARVEKLIQTAKCDLVVANSFLKNNKAFIFDKNKNVIAKASTRQAVAKALVATLKEQL